MPRLPINYSKTIIYKICCKDVNITEIYIGHTTDLTRRKAQHKHRCNNENLKEYNFNVYQFIRENGNWDNWSVIPIEEFSCENINQALIRERYWIEELQASLNKVIPTRTKKEWREDNKEQLKEKKKEYFEENKEYLKEYYKEWREDNKEKIKERDKKYYENNKEIINEKNKNKYYENNKEKKLEKQKGKFICECGGYYDKHHKSHHLKTQKHQDYLTQTIPANNLT